MDLLENQKAAETIDGIYNDLESEIMENIARHLSDWNQPIDSDQWLLQKLAEIGALNRENISLIAKWSGISRTAAERMLNEAAEKAIESIEPGFEAMARRGLADPAVSVPKSRNVKQAMDTMKKQAKDSLNMTNTTMLYKARDTYKMVCAETAKKAIEILNNNAGAVVTGAESRQQALRSTIKQLNAQGITGYVDKRGRNWTPEAYVNMCMRNTVKNVAEEMQTARCLDHGITLIEISSHAGARPKCARDQGRIYDLNNGSGTTTDATGKEIRYYPWNSSSYGQPDGILGINCRHHKFPFRPGVNIQTYFPTEDMDANNKLYKQTQVQRAMERDIRKQKRECMLYDTVGDAEAFEEASVKLKVKEERLKNYVDSHKDLYRRKDREQIVGFDKSVSNKAGWANKRNDARKKSGVSVVKTKDSGIIKKNTLEMNLQIFSESDIKKQESGSLKRAIRKYQKRVKEHEDKLKNPALYCLDWDDKMVCEQEGLKRHWQKEIRNFNQSIEDRIGELKARGDYDE